MPSTEIFRVRNCIHNRNVLFSLELRSKSVSLKILGLKLDCIII